MGMAVGGVEAEAAGPPAEAAAARAGEEEEALLPPAAAASRRGAGQATTLVAALAAVALLAAGVGSLMVARRARPEASFDKASVDEASVDAGVSLWSTRAQIRARIAPVTFGDRFESSPGMQLATPPTCVVGELPHLWPYKEKGGHVEVKLLTYNLFWWNLYGVRNGNNRSASRLIAEAGHERPHDIMAFQECMDPVRVLTDAGLADEYTTFSGDGSNTAAICMAFHRHSWVLLGSGREYVAEDTQMQYFGRRAAQWMRVRHAVSGRTLFFMNHHGPLPVNSGGRCGGAAMAYNLLQVVRRRAREGDAVVLAGDFNADASSATIRRLEQRLHKAYAGTAVNGIDNVFSNLGNLAVVGAANLGSAGSDHDALSVTLALTPTKPSPPGSSTAPPPAKQAPPPPLRPAALRGAAAEPEREVVHLQ